MKIPNPRYGQDPTESEYINVTLAKSLSDALMFGGSVGDCGNMDILIACCDEIDKRLESDD